MLTVPASELRRHGLRYSSDDEPGIRRRRAGRGWSYRHDDGGAVAADQRERISALAIPPAWSDVWICADARGHVQATGRDAAGRKQHRYHAGWRAMRDERKFADLADFAAALPQLRRQVEADLRRGGFDHRKLVALVLALMDSTLIRVGNDEYARTNGTFGLTTLTRRHVVIEPGEVRFRFVGKGGVRHEVEIDDRRLARLVRRCHELGGRELFSFRGDEGEMHRVDSADANDYLRAVVGDAHSVKTFRTWGASSLAVDAFAAAANGDAPDEQVVVRVVDMVAARLGNTRAVARSSYVHPSIPQWATDGRLADAWTASRATSTMQRSERALARLLG